MSTFYGISSAMLGEQEERSGCFAFSVESCETFPLHSPMLLPRPPSFWAPGFQMRSSTLFVFGMPYRIIPLLLLGRLFSCSQRFGVVLL